MFLEIQPWNSAQTNCIIYQAPFLVKEKVVCFKTFVKNFSPTPHSTVRDHRKNTSATSCYNPESPFSRKVTNLYIKLHLLSQAHPWHVNNILWIVTKIRHITLQMPIYSLRVIHIRFSTQIPCPVHIIAQQHATSIMLHAILAMIPHCSASRSTTSGMRRVCLLQNRMLVAVHCGCQMLCKLRRGSRLL